MRFAGAYRAGTDAHAFTFGTWSEFQAKYNELTGSGLRLVSLSAHVAGVVRYST